MPRASTPDPRIETAALTIGDLLTSGRRWLADARPPIGGREASLLLKSVLEIDEAELRAHPERPVARRDAETFIDRLRRRAAGEPAAYLTGHREFYGRPFEVDARVLIPRPESELLVDLALATPLPARPQILDLGTGSGCLAVSLAAEQPAARVTATDISPAALACAAANGRRHRVADRIRFVGSDWTRAVDLRHFDLAVVNPPYLSDEEWRQSAREIREHEPRGALVAAEHGLAEYRRLADAFVDLRPGCRVLFEIGARQAAEVVALCGPILEDDSVQIHRDLSGLDRAVVGTRSNGTESTGR